jgi:hypothetical protein
MSFSPMRTVIALLVLASLASGAFAQTIAKEKGPARVFGQFNFFCLKHLPDLDGVERAAGFGEYDQLYGDDLAPFIPDTPYEKFLGWRYHDHGQEYVLTAMRGKPDETLIAQAPAFAAKTETTCALRVPNTEPERLLDELTRGVGRAPQKTWQDGSTRVYSWTHQTPTTVSFIELHVPENSSAKAMLSASVLSKK